MVEMRLLFDGLTTFVEGATITEFLDRHVITDLPVLFLPAGAIAAPGATILAIAGPCTVAPGVTILAFVRRLEQIVGNVGVGDLRERRGTAASAATTTSNSRRTLAPAPVCRRRRGEEGQPKTKRG